MQNAIGLRLEMQLEKPPVSLFEHERRVLDIIRESPKTVSEITREMFSAGSFQYHTGIGTGVVLNALQGLDEVGMIRYTEKDQHQAFQAA